MELTASAGYDLLKLTPWHVSFRYSINRQSSEKKMNIDGLVVK